MTGLSRPPTSSAPARQVERVRHAIKARLVTVQRVERVSPHIVRVTFTGKSLHDFVSASFDDHVKLMIPPDPSQPVALPQVTPDGLRQPEGTERPLMRDYTPRRFDQKAGELDIEFALHGDGPAAAWAAQARPGQQVGIGGPRGSMVVPVDYEWHLLVGDETSMPAIARRLEELPAGVHAFVRIETTDAADERALHTRATLDLKWVRPAGQGDESALVSAVRGIRVPAGEGYGWAAGETQDIAAVRRVLVSEYGLDNRHIRAAAYWKRGVAGHHENLEG